jgi:hypothetical protein
LSTLQRFAPALALNTQPPVVSPVRAAGEGHRAMTRDAIEWEQSVAAPHA